MKLKKLYQEAVKQGITADIRGSKAITALLKDKKQQYEKLNAREKEFFDLDNLFNPFADTRIVNGNPEAEIKSMIVGIDVEPAELILVDRLKEKGTKIDLVVSHHPVGRAYANFYEVMDLQIDAFAKEGISISAAQTLLSERKNQVERRVSAVNHQRPVDVAKLLDINLMCMHTVCDNFAYQYMKKSIDKQKPENLDQVLNILYSIEEYKQAAKNNNPPMIAIGSKRSRCKHIHIEFTGGTEGPQEVYKKLSSCGVDTIIAMHQSEEHYKKCKEANINVIFASHIASDNLGINCMLDQLSKLEKFKIYEFSGFRRVARKS